MEKLLEDYSGAWAAFAPVVTTLVVNSICNYLMYQNELLDSAENLRKF